MKHLCLVPLWLAGAWLAACGGSPPPARHARAVNDPLRPHGLSTEWLYVTQSPGLEDKPDCQRVHAYVLGESGCKSKVCLHAASLANDWHARCGSKAEPSTSREIEHRRQEYLARVAGPEDPCAVRLEEWLHHGCGHEGACQPAVSRWATQCGKAIGSPLALLMLQKTIEQSLSDPQPVTLDLRTCGDLSKELLRAAGCEQQSKCEDALPKLDLYRQRCSRDADAPLGIAESIAELAMRLGANQSPRPMPIAAEPDELSPERHALVLLGTSGAVLRVCGKPVLDLKTYLAERQHCSPGEVVTVRAFGEPNDRKLKVGTFDHANDRTFARRFPSLSAVGEREARDRVALDALAAALEPILERPNEPTSIGLFCQALGEAASSLDNTEGARGLLGDKDSGLQQLLVAIGNKKAHYAAEKVKGKQRSALVARASALVCADLDSSGRVSVGANNPGMMVELDRVFPRSMSAYRAELESLVAELDKAPFDRRQERTLLAEIESRGQACSAASDRAAQAERMLIDCAYGNEVCDAGDRHRLEQRLDKARSEIETARRAILLGIFGLPRARQAALHEQVTASSACLR